MQKVDTIGAAFYPFKIHKWVFRKKDKYAYITSYNDIMQSDVFTG